MYEVFLRKLSLNDGKLRTRTVEGFAWDLPEAGSSFILIAPPLGVEGTRYIETSKVVLVKYTASNTYMFRTENSTYELIVLGETDTETVSEVEELPSES
jgi:hypothetical protein